MYRVYTNVRGGRYRNEHGQFAADRNLELLIGGGSYKRVMCFLNHLCSSYIWECRKLREGRGLATGVCVRCPARVRWVRRRSSIRTRTRTRTRVTRTQHEHASTTGAGATFSPHLTGTYCGTPCTRAEMTTTLWCFGSRSVFVDLGLCAQRPFANTYFI